MSVTVRFVVVGLVFATQGVSGALRCNLPGRSVRTANNLSEGNDLGFETFADGTVVAYSCPELDSPLLVGPETRACRGGRWSGVIPRCASKVIVDILPSVRYFEDHQSIELQMMQTRLDYVQVSFKGPRNLTLVSVEPDHIKISRCDLKSTSPSNESLLNSFSYVMSCRTRSSELRFMSFSLHCENSTLAKLEKSISVSEVTLFAVTIDDCAALDAPQFGFVRELKNKTFEFLCVNQMFKLDRESNFSCSLDKPWLSPNCVTNMVCLKFQASQLTNLNVTYINDYNWTHATLDSAAVFTCSDVDGSVTGDSIRYCKIDGSWSGADVLCKNHTLKAFANNQDVRLRGGESGLSKATLLVILFIGICGLIALVGFVIYRSKNQIRQAHQMRQVRKSFSFPDSTEVTGKKYKMSYKMGMNVDDELSPDFGLKTPTEDKVFNLQVPKLTLKIGNENEFLEMQRASSIDSDRSAIECLSKSPSFQDVHLNDV